MSLFKKIPLFTWMMVVLAAISISLLNIEDLSWAANTRSYMGLIIAFVLLVVKIVFRIR
ncbi:MAG: hypothetical protein ACNA7V_14465 [Bacteroidales bacterium]